MSEIDEKYTSLPGAEEILGQPIGPEGDAINGGRYRHYQFGSIYYCPSIGAHEVHGAIGTKWASMTWERGPLGYPITDESPTEGNQGRFNHFEHGSIYWTPRTGAHEVHGPIRDLWASLDWERGVGYPWTDVTDVADFADIEVSWFTNGILANPQIAPPEAFAVDRTGSLLVVAPSSDFAAAAGVEDFLAHKRRTGVAAFLHVLSEDESDGSDSAALRLKGRIAEAAAWLNVRWVMFLGDASLIPTQHRCTTQVPDDHLETAWYTPTDFYYADLYSHGVGFVHPVGALPEWVSPDTWDANGDHRYDEHHWADDTSVYNPDGVQAQPVVAIGRVPAHTAQEAGVYLTKVIGYETREPAGAERLTVLTDYNYYSDDGRADLAATLLDTAGIAQGDAASVGLGWPAGVSAPIGTSVGDASSTRAAAASSRILAYIGHGDAGYWAVASDTGGDVDGNNVQTFTNSMNLPIVLGIGCRTSPIKDQAPGDGTWYFGADMLAHSYTIHPTYAVHRVQAAPDRRLAGSIVQSAAIQERFDVSRPAPSDLIDSMSPGFDRAWLFNPNGGGIIYFGETAVCPDNFGVELLGRMLRYMNPRSVLGDAWLAGQADYKLWAPADARQGAPRIYLTYMHLFGDPSLRLW